MGYRAPWADTIPGVLLFGFYINKQTNKQASLVCNCYVLKNSQGTKTSFGRRKIRNSIHTTSSTRTHSNTFLSPGFSSTTIVTIFDQANSLEKFRFDFCRMVFLCKIHKRKERFWKTTRPNANSLEIFRIDFCRMIFLCKPHKEKGRFWKIKRPNIISLCQTLQIVCCLLTMECGSLSKTE